MKKCPQCKIMFIKVKVFPKSKKEKIIQKSKYSFEIFVKERPQNNQANFKVFEVLAQHFQISLNCIKIVSGAKKQNKRFEINFNNEKRH